jgi:MFS family permease
MSLDAAPARGQPNPGRRWMIWGGAIVGALVVYLVGAAVIPRWWARRVGNLVDGRLSAGAAGGMLFGVLFTILPLLVLWAAWRFRRRKLALWLVVLAIVLAIPNLMTLAIVLGGGSAAHAGERILDVDGPGFRGGSLVGAMLGAALVGLVVYLAASRRSSRHRTAQLHDQLRHRDEP